MAEALGLEAPILVERQPADDQLPAEEPESDVDSSPLSDEPGGSVH
jgi:hypothetical protein